MIDKKRSMDTVKQQTIRQLNGKQSNNSSLDTIMKRYGKRSNWREIKEQVQMREIWTKCFIVKQ